MATTLKTITLAAVVMAGTASMALAQNGPAYGSSNGMPPASYKGPGAMPSYPAGGNTAVNAAASGGSGTHQNAQKTGSAENTQKVLGNQNGYAFGGNGMPPASYKGPAAMPSYPVAKSGAPANRNGSRSGRRLYSYYRGSR